MAAGHGRRGMRGSTSKCGPYKFKLPGLIVKMTDCQRSF